MGPGAEATIGRGTVLVENVRVAGGAKITDSVLWGGCAVERQAEIDGALFANNVKVGTSAVVRPGAVLGEGSVVSDFSRTS